MIHYVTTNGIGDAWVGNELRMVRQAGIPVVLHSMRSPHQHFFASDWAAALHRQTRQIYPLPPLKLAAAVALAPARFGGRFFGALGNALFGKRESLRVRLACLAHFFVACHWAGQLRRSVDPVALVHSQWAHSGASIAMYGAWLLSVPFSFTGHAADLFRERAALEDKIRRAAFIGCISEFHRAFYKSLGARDDQLELVYCGIDVSHFTPRDQDDHARGRDGRPVHILSAARLVPKKGLAHLVEACRILVDRGMALHCTIAGSGPLEVELRRLVCELGLSDHVKLTGEAIKQEEIPAFMNGGDIYCLPCVQAKDGDIDGLPQMLMEAMACGVPVVSTRVAGIPDLIIDDRTGVLVEPGHPARLADALEALIKHPERAARLAEAGLRHVHARFDITRCLEPLLDRYRHYLDAAGRKQAGPAPSTGADPAAAQNHPALSRP
jgi:glycosyltransferase involved in cell wall biosynthesis